MVQGQEDPNISLTRGDIMGPTLPSSPFPTKTRPRARQPPPPPGQGAIAFWSVQDAKPKMTIWPNRTKRGSITIVERDRKPPQKMRVLDALDTLGFWAIEKVADCHVTLRLGWPSDRATNAIVALLLAPRRLPAGETMSERQDFDFGDQSVPTPYDSVLVPPVLRAMGRTLTGNAPASVLMVRPRFGDRYRHRRPETGRQT